MAKGLLSDQDIEAEAAKLNDREARLQDRTARPLATVENLPDPDTVKTRARKMAAREA